MNKKRIVSMILVSVAALTLGLTELRAGGKQAAGSEKMQLTIWQLNGKQDALDVLVKEYNAAHPEVQIVPSYYDTDGIKDACKVAASSKTLPDMWFNWGGSLGGFFAENNLVYDLSSYAKTNGWDKIFSPGALSLCTLSGKLAGYPISYNVLDVYYRKDIFARYNLKVPATFEEFENVCAVLKQNGIIPISTGGLYGWHTMRFVELLIEHYAGAELHDKMSTFQVSHDNEATVQALTKYKEFCDKGYFPTGFITASPNDTQLAVFSGQAAMDIQGQWYDGLIIQEGQDMSLYGTFAFPSGGGNRLSAFAEMTQLNAGLSPEKLEACIKFLDFYFSKESLARFGQYFNQPLPRLDAQMPGDQPNVAIMLNTSNRNGTFTITDQAFPTEIADELFRVQDGIANNQVTPKEGAARIQAAITAYRKK
ncbi:MAG: extracellular solute-binding protein [Treponema sp.]|nr:extracellular solute-binding protein [Treponema sp.]